MLYFVLCYVLNFVLQGELSDAGGTSRAGRRGGQGVRGGGRLFSVSVFKLLRLVCVL